MELAAVFGTASDAPSPAAELLPGRARQLRDPDIRARNGDFHPSYKQSIWILVYLFGCFLVWLQRFLLSKTWAMLASLL